MTSEQDPANQFFELATVYRLSALLFAALELDVFSLIPAAGAPASAIARALGVEEERLRLLLNPLAGMGILTLRQDGGFALPPAFAALLAHGPEYRGDQFLRHKEAAGHWLRLAEIVRGDGSSPAYYGELLQSASVQPYLESIRRTNRPHAEAMLRRLADLIPRLRRVLDLGGGHGYYGERLLELNPALRVTVLDVEQSIAYCRERQQDNPNRERFDFLVGDARTHDLENAFDLVLINDLLHYFPMPEKAEIVRRGVRALAPGGTLALMKVRLDAAGVRPPSSALFSLMVFVNTQCAWLESDAEAEELLRQAGLRELRTLQLHEERTLLLGVR
ncbi:MAG TPA: class I SAM-dependent methyltransferase [Dehalococcoidia bacterium]|nr:class I SAM-dependent methyltransferase [Dehalococcoidia bacterium]